MKILHVLDHSLPLHSGYAFRTIEILREQRRQGWETYQLTSSKHYGAAQAEERIEGFDFSRTIVPDGGWRSWPLVGQAAVIRDTRNRLMEVADRVRPDILHAHSPCLNGIAAISVGRKLALPVVYEMRASWEDAAVDHGTAGQGSLRYRASRALESWTLRHANAVTTICEGLRDDIVSRGVAPERVTLIPNAVNIDEFPIIGQRDSSLVSKFGLQDSFTLGFIGSFYGYEGLEILIDALPIILRLEPRAKLLLVGGGPEEARLRLRVEQLAVGERVVFAGRVPHSDVSRYYSLIDLLVYPRKSIRLTETVTPLKPLEAMALGKVLVASDVGGHRELIQHGRTGFLFKADDANALAESVLTVQKEGSRWDEIRRAGRLFVETERNWHVSVEKYRGVYEPLLKR